MVEWRSTPTLLVAILGLLLVIGSVSLFPYAGQDRFVNCVEESSPAERYPELNYSDLSTEAKTAFDSAVNSSDSCSTVYGTSNKPKEFEYYDDGSIYSIQHQDREYELVTISGEDGDSSRFNQLLAGGIGFGLVIIGIYNYHRGSHIYSVYLSAVIVALGGFYFSLPFLTMFDQAEISVPLGFGIALSISLALSRRIVGSFYN